MKLLVFVRCVFNTLFLKIKGVKVHGFTYVSGKVKMHKHSVLEIFEISLRKNGKILVRENAECIIGKGTTFNENCSIICRKEIKIGSNNAFGQNVLIIDHDHDYRNNMKDLVSDTIEIGDNCWIGANVMILKGSKIGNNVVIGAGTIIKGVVEDYTVVYNKQNLVYKKYEANTN